MISLIRFCQPFLLCYIVPYAFLLLGVAAVHLVRVRLVRDKCPGENATHMILLNCFHYGIDAHCEVKTSYWCNAHPNISMVGVYGTENGVGFELLTRYIEGTSQTRW